MSEADREKWNARYAGETLAMGAGPNALAEALARALPTEGRALEVACGEGQLAVWLAQRGLRVDAIDVAANGLAKLRRQAQTAGVADSVRIVEHDLDLGLPDLEPGYRLVTCFHFHAASLFPSFREVLAPGGMLLVEVLTQTQPLGVPPMAESFLAPRCATLGYAGDLVVHYYREGVIRGRGQAQLLAQRPPVSDVNFDRPV